ncbi:hypothetical protein WM13_14080 [Burkholderia ubonensis]|nr:hypothetical protein WM10_26215 [Burkholderia ubonensis]KWK42247.1 hypothetical protein WM13_14080 [Burkholderia ubonensis]
MLLCESVSEECDRRLFSIATCASAASQDIDAKAIYQLRCDFGTRIADLLFECLIAAGLEYKPAAAVLLMAARRVK